ncbi:MAG: cytochrome c3 family protein [Thermoanaerobaculia bacterium]
MRSGRTVAPAGLVCCAVALLAGVVPALGQHDSVVSTPHNLSVSGPGEIRAVSETEVCKFCHIPHNAEVPTPLWSRPLSRAQYATPQLQLGRGSRQPAPQPDGSSRLCMSCHDGTIALGEVVGERQPIAMAGGERLGPGRKGYLGTDLSGSHPISFALATAAVDPVDDSSDMGFRSLLGAGRDDDVRLDAEGKMQCTTCHDAHADRFYVPGRVPRFWVRPTVDEVCLTCHVLR